MIVARCSCPSIPSSPARAACSPASRRSPRSRCRDPIAAEARGLAAYAVARHLCRRALPGRRPDPHPGGRRSGSVATSSPATRQRRSCGASTSGCLMPSPRTTCTSSARPSWTTVGCPASRSIRRASGRTTRCCVAASGAHRRRAPHVTSSGSATRSTALATLDAALASAEVHARAAGRGHASRSGAPRDQAGGRPGPPGRRPRGVPDGVADALAVPRVRPARAGGAGRGRARARAATGSTSAGAEHQVGAEFDGLEAHMTRQQLADDRDRHNWLDRGRVDAAALHRR